MPDTTTDNPLQAVLYTNHEDFGHSESWILRDTTWAAGMATLAELAQARAYVLGDETQLYYAELRQLEPPYEQQGLPDIPYNPLPIWEPPSNGSVGLLWRFQTLEGRWGNHLFRAVSDDEITNNRWIRQGLQVPAGPVAAPLVPALTPKDDLWEYVLALFRDRTCHGHDNGDGTWGLSWWDEVMFRKVSTRNAGSPYVWVSWEPTDWTNAPKFSPCGMITGVLRAAYYVECRFHTNAPAQEITYYWAKDTADVLPVRSIFWGWAKDKAITNDSDPGENTGPHAPTAYGRAYSLGLSWGVAAGTAYVGTEAQFLGQTPKPWLDEDDAEPHYGLPCDMPAPVPIKFDTDPLTTEVDDVTWVTIDSATMELIEVASHHALLKAKASLKASLKTSGPTYTGVKELEFKPRDGFYLTDEGSGKIGVGKDAFETDYVEVFGDVDNVATGESNQVVLYPYGPYHVLGFAGGTPGRLLRVINRSPSNTLYLLNNFSSSTPGNGMQFGQGVLSWPLQPGGEARLRWDSFHSGWMLDDVPVRDHGGLTSGDSTNLVAFKPRDGFHAYSLCQSNLAESIGRLHFAGRLNLDVAYVLDAFGAPFDPGDYQNAVIWNALAEDFDGVSDGENGRILAVMNREGSQPITVKHLSGLVAAGEQIFCPGAADFTVEAGDSFVLMYDNVSGFDRWRVISQTHVDGLSAQQLAEVMALIP